jgi:hypothetical protein
VGEKTRICLCFWRIIPEIDLILAQLRIAFPIIFAILTFIHWTHQSFGKLKSFSNEE